MKKDSTQKKYAGTFLLFCIPLLFYNCETIENEDPHTRVHSEQLRIVSLDDVPKLKPVMQQLKNVNPTTEALARGGETYKGVDHVLTEEIIEVINSHGKCSYTFGIDTDFKNTNIIENLHLLETTDGYLAYIMRYEPDENWRYDPNNFTPEGDLVIDPRTFQGNITKFTLEREIVWTTLPPPPGYAGLGWIEVCVYSVAQYCTNDGHGGSNGEPHVRGPECVDGPFFTETTSHCVTVYVGSGNTYYEDDPEHPMGGGNSSPDEDEEDCIRVSGTLIQNNLPISGIQSSCIKGPVVSIKQPKFDDDCNTSKEDLKKVFPNMPDAKAELLASIINEKGKDFGIDTDEDLWHFLSQAGHETGGFSTLQVTENLNYSSASLIPKRYNKFTLDTISNPTKLYAGFYTGNPEKLANAAMCCINGNGDEASGDGWKYRGRGIFQLTWKDNYTAFKTWYNNKYDPNIDPVSNPDLISTDDNLAILSGLWYYKTRVVDKININSTTSVDQVTKPINAAKAGIEDRKKRFQRAKDSINCL